MNMLCRTGLSGGRTILLMCAMFLLPGRPLVHTQTVSDAQQTEEIKSYLAKIDQGQADDVRRILPDLIAKYQNTPGLLYLEGRLAADGIEGVKFYQSVVDNFPKSEWAEDALYRIYQYYQAIGLYKTADLKLAQLKNDYPNSAHLTPAGAPSPDVKPADSSLQVARKDTIAVTVQQKTPPPEAKPEPPVNTAPPDTAGRQLQPAQAGYTLQVGAFSTLANAEKQKAYFDDLGYPAEIANKVRNGKSLHLVWVGHFTTSAEAIRFRDDVKSRFKLGGIVVERY
ncbi:MAG TPA: SPOR domain-containing protein [Bacteroidota bacterium]|nr:SPOR domain-containing protein [Bacteroidota bacterium]